VTLKANDAGKASIVILATLDDPSGGWGRSTSARLMYYALGDEVG